MERILTEMKGHYEGHELLLYSQCNQLFHQVLYDACPNRTAVEMTANLKRQMRKYNTKTILIPGRDTQSFEEHSAILRAVKNRDAEAAAQLISLHIINVRKTFEEHYSLLSSRRDDRRPLSCRSPFAGNGIDLFPRFPAPGAQKKLTY
jgi:DNA-binding GntR family transcriptional regulator